MAKVNFVAINQRFVELYPLSVRSRPEVFHPKVFMCEEHRWLKLINRLKFLVLKFGIVYPDI